MLENYKKMYVFWVNEELPSFWTPLKQFYYMRHLLETEFTGVVGPNNDRLFSTSWMDLTTNRLCWVWLKMISTWYSGYMRPNPKSWQVIGHHCRCGKHNWSIMSRVPDGCNVPDRPHKLVKTLGEKVSNLKYLLWQKCICRVIPWFTTFKYWLNSHLVWLRPVDW